MSSKILTSQITDIHTFVQNPYYLLNNTKDKIIAISVKNIPIFYAITHDRLEKLLNIENIYSLPISDVMLDNQFFEDSSDVLTTTTIPIGKFPMYPEWQPGDDFQRMAAIWGVVLLKPVTKEELASFITYWQAEGKIFHHVQWQQKLARSVQICRNNKNKSKRNINLISEPDNQIPQGFRGSK